MDCIDYTIITEIPGQKASREQLSMLYTRYCFASEFCSGKTVLEIGCGAGIGLSYLAKTARSVIGGDFNQDVLKIAKYGLNGSLRFLCLDAQRLPFADNSFDIVILFEVIYYLSSPNIFIEEARRVLKKDGKLLISTANKSWSCFYPSPYSVKYFSVEEIFSLLNRGFCRVELYGSFRSNCHTIQDKIIYFVRKVANAFHLMPKTMKKKACLKRIFCGKPFILPQKIDDNMAEYDIPATISRGSLNSQYKVLYAVGCKC
jgi:ubiquinone/menaquinone biosynthesis C-methylase UbiE